MTSGFNSSIIKDPFVTRMENRNRAGVFRKNNEFIEDHCIQIPSLRTSTKKLTKAKAIKEEFWDKKIYHISERNIDMYKTFKTHFSEYK